VKARYLEQWTLPGGGVHKRETPEDAAARELREETGIVVTPDGLRLIGLLSSFKEGKSDYVAMFACEIGPGVAPTPGGEIADAAWFPIDALPEPTSERTRRRINGFLSGESMRGVW
jgi:8-oxo-dGTP pyrophosphatase MutT (NUDIX family)